MPRANTPAPPQALPPATWTVMPLTRTLGDHAISWDALAGRARLKHPMLDSRFVDALLRHFGHGNEVLCRLGPPEDPQALCVLRPKGPGVWETFLPSQAQVGAQLVNRADQLRGLVARLPGGAYRADLLCLDIDEIDPDAMVAAPPPDSMMHALTVRVRTHQDFDTYWNERPKNLRHNMRRYERRVQEADLAQRFISVRDPAQIGEAVRRYAALESRGWKGQAGTALAPGNAQEAFYIDLLTAHARSGDGAVYELWLGDTLAASRITLFAGTTLAILKTTYDEALSQYAPGRLHLRLLIEEACADPARHSIEFCTDATPDQLAWASEQRPIEHWTIHRNAVVAALFDTTRALVTSLRAPPPVPAAERSEVQVFEHSSQLPKDVQQLVDEQGGASMQFSLPWLQNLETHVFAGHAGVRYFVLRINDAPVALLPTVAERRPLGRIVLGLGNYYTALLAPVVRPWVKPLALVPLLAAVRRHHAPLQAFRFEPMDPTTADYRTLAAALRLDGQAVFRFFCFGNWYLRAPADWPAYLASRDSKMRSNIKRMTQKLAADGGRLEIITDAADLDRALDAYDRVYAQSWKVPEPYTGFVPGLIRTCAAQGWLRLGLVWLDEQPIAAQLWIVAHGKADIYKVAYDEAFKKYSPGTVLTAALIQHVIERDRVYEVDYLIGDDSYKKGWMSHRRERWGIVAYNLRTLSGLAGFGREALGRMLKPWVQRLKALRTKAPADTP